MRPQILLIHHPTPALHMSGFLDPAFVEFRESGIYLGNIYSKIMPPSLPRVASVLTQHLDADVQIFDLRLRGVGKRTRYKEILWEDQYDIHVDRWGAPFDECDDAVSAADWVGLSSHFTFESGVVRDLIQHVKRVKPAVKVMVGGADVKARPADYVRFGADLAFVGDCDPSAVASYEGGQHIVAAYSHPFEELTRPSFGLLNEFSQYEDSHDGPVPEGVSFPIAFIYFTRGCPRECDFCESRRSVFQKLDIDRSIAMLEYYHSAGIRSLNFSDDNLLLVAAKEQGRRDLLELFKAMRALKFAWEFPNGLEIGRFLSARGLDEELMGAMFGRSLDVETGRVVGAYRLYVPLETFERREDYKKLKDSVEQNKVLSWLAASDLVEIDFGVVIPPDASEETFELTRAGYLDIKDLFQSRGKVRARYAAFHLIPISLYRTMKTKYTVDEFPEGWNFYFPVYDGKNFTARELFERRLKLIKEIDETNFVGMKHGQYTYG